MGQESFFFASHVSVPNKLVLQSWSIGGQMSKILSMPCLVKADPGFH